MQVLFSTFFTQLKVAFQMFGHKVKRQQIIQFSEIHVNLVRSKGVVRSWTNTTKKTLKGVLCPQIAILLLFLLSWVTGRIDFSGP